MKIPNLSKITKKMKLPSFSINIKTFLMWLLLIFYLVMIMVHFFMKTLENFSRSESRVINDLSGNLQKQIDINRKNTLDNSTVMTNLIPDIQYNIFDLSNNFYSSFYKNKPIDLSSNFTPTKPIDLSSNFTPI